MGGADIKRILGVHCFNIDCYTIADVGEVARTRDARRDANQRMALGLMIGFLLQLLLVVTIFSSLYWPPMVGLCLRLCKGAGEVAVQRSRRDRQQHLIQEKLRLERERVDNNAGRLVNKQAGKQEKKADLQRDHEKIKEKDEKDANLPQHNQRVHQNNAPWELPPIPSFSSDSDHDVGADGHAAAVAASAPMVSVHLPNVANDAAPPPYDSEIGPR